MAYGNNLAVIFKNVKDIQTQLNKIDKYCDWASIE